VSPKVAKFLLASNIPYHKFDSFEVELFHIESYGRDSVDDISKFEWVEYGGFTCAIKPKHNNFALFFGYLFAENIFENVAHLKYYKLKEDGSKAKFINSVRVVF